MKNIILSAIVVIAASVSASAQTENKFSFSVGPELGFATGTFSQTHSLGIGGSAQAEYYIMDKLKGTATIGLLAYLGKSYNSSATNAAQTIIPIRVGAKYFLSGGFYGGAQLGMAILGNWAPNKGGAFAYSPLMLGYEFKTKSNKSVDAVIKYDGYTSAYGTIGAFGARLAYVF